MLCGRRFRLVRLYSTLLDFQAVMSHLRLGAVNVFPLHNLESVPTQSTKVSETRRHFCLHASFVTSIWQELDRANASEERDLYSTCREEYTSNRDTSLAFKNMIFAEIRLKQVSLRPDARSMNKHMMEYEASSRLSQHIEALPRSRD
jgi:hypothetical protein